jgi:hypothetical protein
MTQFDRFKFYGFGFVLGILVLSMVLNKKCSNSFGFLSPKKMKMEELQKQNFKISAYAQCQLNEINMNEAQLKTIFATSKINYDRSDIMAKPYGVYIVEGKMADGKNFTCKVGDNDFISEIIELTVAETAFKCEK